MFAVRFGYYWHELILQEYLIAYNPETIVKSGLKTLNLKIFYLFNCRA